MDKERIKKLAADPHFIKGVYNYCDRWCERCPLTSRCFNFAMADEQFPDQENLDIKNEIFWKKLSESFQLTLELLKETAEERGIDLDSLDIDKVQEEEDRFKEEVAKNHECSRMAKTYGEMVDNWFDSIRDLFDQGKDEPTWKQGLDLPNVHMVDEISDFEDAVEVIRWYQHQIYVKLMRALRGSLDEKEEILDEFPKDSDGSAKVALIAIDRSMAAWSQMSSHFLAREGDINDLLMQLESLRRKVEKAFPDARAFIRLGFDKIDLNS